MDYMPLDLAYGSNPIFDYYIQPEQPKPHWIGWKWLLRITWWTRLRKKDGSKAWFINIAALGHAQAYYGTAKCDATRTFMLWSGQLGGGPPGTFTGYVMTGWKQEHAAARWFRSSTVSDKPDWKGMGSC